jgi:hypothetical protein
MTTKTDVNQTANTTPHFTPLPAVSLLTYRARHFNGKNSEMAKHYGLSNQQIERWLTGEAVVIDECIYLKKSDFQETRSEIKLRIKKLASNPNNANQDVLCHDLSEYIAMEYGGNATAFAQTNGTSQQQSFRWINLARCVYLCGQVYRHQSDLNDK